MTGFLSKRVEEMASEFIVGTCQLLPKCYDSVSDCMYDPLAQGVHCGSAMEFYLRSLTFICIDDVDALTFERDKLAFDGDSPELPYDVSWLRDTIRCYKIEPYLGYPGFVRLRIMRTLKYNWRYKKYEFENSTMINEYHRFDHAAKAAKLNMKKEGCGRRSHTVRGPAITMQHEVNTKSNTKSCPVDSVHSIRCPKWPKESQEWSMRPRNNGWPSAGTISEVARYGCHVVYVQHRACRDDEHQWRFSFSVAEVNLLQSCTKVQQIVYHLLRFFAKRELIQKDCPKEDEVLCTYHLKTLMLWTCEEKPPEWWNSSSVIGICCELLKILSVWLKRRNCPNYFIPEANLLNLPLRFKTLEQTESRLNEFCNCGTLGYWFVENCIQPFMRKYAEGGYRRGISPDFVYYIIPILEFQQTLKFKSLDYLFLRGIIDCNNYIRYLIKFGTNLGPKSCLSYSCFMRKVKLILLIAELPVPEDVECFTLFDLALCNLNAAYGLHCGKMAWDSELFLKSVRGLCFKSKSARCKFHRLPNPLPAEGSQFQFWQAQNLMKNLTGLNSPSEFQLLSLLSTSLLLKALTFADSQYNGIDLATRVYLAALHFATSEYQIAIDFCSEVFIDQTLDMETETLNAGCLFFIDDVVRIVGFSLLSKTVRENKSFTGRQIFLDLRLSPKVFCHYLAIVLVEKLNTQIDLSPCSPTSAFPLDHFLFAVARRNFDAWMKSSVSLGCDRLCVYHRTELVAASFADFINLLKVAAETSYVNASGRCVNSRSVSDAGDVILTVTPSIIKAILIKVLIECALETMTSFYSAIRKDFGIRCNTIDCYRALHFYKCRQYDKTLHVCEQILKESDLQSDFKHLALTNVLVLPSLLLFFDGDVQALIGFHSLFWYLSPLVDDMRDLDALNEGIFAHLFALSVYCSTKPMQYCVSFPDSIKYHYSLGRHFLAKYLKLKCCISCNHPCTQAMAEFVAVKINRPLEAIIRRFLLQKLCRNLKQ